jgi:hypothetical protein
MHEQLEGMSLQCPIYEITEVIDTSKIVDKATQQVVAIIWSFCLHQ